MLCCNWYIKGKSSKVIIFYETRTVCIVNEKQMNKGWCDVDGSCWGLDAGGERRACEKFQLHFNSPTSTQQIIHAWHAAPRSQQWRRVFLKTFLVDFDSNIDVFESPGGFGVFLRTASFTSVINRWMGKVRFKNCCWKSS